MFGAVPAVDVTETDKGYDITAELPGMGEKNIEVTVANGVLTIKGEKQDEKEEKKKDYYIRERSFGSFVRAFQVPDGVDTDKIEARRAHGDAAEECGSAEGGKEDRGQSSLIFAFPPNGRPFISSALPPRQWSYAKQLTTLLAPNSTNAAGKLSSRRSQASFELSSCLQSAPC